MNNGTLNFNGNFEEGELHFAKNNVIIDNIFRVAEDEIIDFIWDSESHIWDYK